MPTANRNFVVKGWGHEDWLDNREKYCGKILFIKKDRRMSWHFHKVKEETFYCREGAACVIFSMDDDYSKASSLVLSRGESFHVPVGMRHQLIGIEDSEIFEMSTHHEDSDSYRLIKGD